ncbi:MAG TPA: 2-oxoacid:acceptor oxidoreductase family protein, partial [Dehalococcoidales bacterium]|nr:2-oxoacid:acceptor oxidoreductase family protein [Dehalococcoidales bacterium]
MASEINVLVGGEAGQGIQTIGFILAKIFARAGANVFADQDYESRVRGGHNFYRVRASADKVNAIREEVNILVAIDQNTINLHRKELIKGGVIIFDSDKNKVENSDTINLGLPMG